ncbi:ATP-binding protein [Vibrio tapetis]|uniref:hybrid sensor histidine kinase/response regulator n=1 Tax=Vibrio tapetis TaxID=52443 RepID=UPI000C83880B|nr:ATP-binding protein [Vibrio tapetis]
MSILAYSNSQYIEKTQVKLSQIGIELIIQRDNILHRNASSDVRAFELTKHLVETENQAQKLVKETQDFGRFSLLDSSSAVHNTAQEFALELREQTQKIDMLVGLQVAKKYTLFRLHSFLEGKLASYKKESWLEWQLFNFMDQVIGDSIQDSQIRLFSTQLSEIEQRIQGVTQDIVEQHGFVFIGTAEQKLYDLKQMETLLAGSTLLLSFFLIALLVVHNILYQLKKLRILNQRLAFQSKQAQKAAKAKANFLATMSHELRTPMNGVLGLSEIVLSETKEDSTKENIKLILESGQHLVTLLNDILDYSKVEENKLSFEKVLFDITDVIKPVISAVSPLANEKKLELLIENKVDAEVQFEGDIARIRQIVFNLVGNAVKFTQQGYVRVRAEQRDDPERSLQLTVTDTGDGIAQDKQSVVFESFEQADSSTTRKFGGTGLGLAIVKRLTQLMGGRIELRSTVGLGSSFSVILPIRSVVRSTSTEATANISVDPKPDSKSLQILLAEDNRVNAIVAKSFCLKLGHSVDIAVNGLIATQMVQEKSYDLILMDNHMPEMNGVEATRYIRQELNCETVIFAYTADVFREAHDNLIASGADHVLTKPLQRSSFSDALSQFSNRLTLDEHLGENKKQRRHETEHDGQLLQRETLERLTLTEEELTHSKALQLLEQDEEAYLALIDECAEKFDDGIEALIVGYMQTDLDSLNQSLGQLSEFASRLGLTNMVGLQNRIKADLARGQLPEIDRLQELVNLMAVNVHHAQRMRETKNQQLDRQ